MNGMKRILFLTLLSCVGLCTHVMAEEKKGDLDKEEERSISHDPVKVEMSESMLTLHFIFFLGDVSIWIVDDRGTLVYEESLLISSPQSYCVPMINCTENLRLIILGDNIDLELPIFY